MGNEKKTKRLSLSSYRKSRRCLGRENRLKGISRKVIDENLLRSSSSVEITTPIHLHNEDQHNINDIENVPMEIEADTSCPEYKVSGRRVVEIQSFFESIIHFQHIDLFSCGSRDLKILKEQRLGLISKLFIECSICKSVSTIFTDKNEPEDMNINKAAVLGTISTGGGHSQLQEFLALCNIPCMSYQTFASTQNEVAPHIYSTLHVLIEAAGQEEARLAIQKGDIDSEGVPKITVIADGAWCKRSYKSNYNASSGVAVIIGERTKKILYLGVKNKYCYLCTRAENRKEPVTEHVCFKNWNKSSTAIESEIIVEGFEQSMEMHGVKYAYLIGDGDSSVTRKIADARPYKNLIVHKIECRNHLLRNFCNHLRELSNKRVSSKRQIVSSEQRTNLKNIIFRFRRGIQAAVTYRSKEDSNHEEKVASLRGDILNSAYHVFGDHSKCADYFCKGHGSYEKNWVEEMTISGLFQDIEVILNRLVQHSDSLLLDMDNNSAECYNSVVAKFVGGKRINFSAKESYQLRCHAAGICFNAGCYKYPQLIIKSITNRSPGKFLKSYCIKKEKNSIKRKIRRTLFPEKHKKKITNAEADRDYGPEANAIQEDLPELFVTERNTFIASLQKTVAEVEDLQKKTIGQSSNNTWIEERYKRLTASSFGKICKMRSSTSCVATVKSLLYNTFSGSKATDWGKTHEPIAIKMFQEKFGLSVTPCGLFVDKTFGFLGASPAGLVGDDIILEIKCPYSIRNMAPADAIKQKKLIYCGWNGDKFNLKKTSNYYYQVQGQLKVTDRSFCYFIIWTPEGMETEKIYRDDLFWLNKMQPFLVNLPKIYQNCFIHNIPKNCQFAIYGKGLIKYNFLLINLQCVNN